MDQLDKPDYKADAWQPLKEFTSARIAIGRTGNAIPTTELLAFRLAHGHARDAVYSELDMHQLIDRTKQFNLPVFHLHTKAVNRQQYLQRPDYGRTLADESLKQIDSPGIAQTDVAIVITEGLSATAINHYAVDLLEILMFQLSAARLKIAPLTVVEQGRVAVADEIGYAFKAKLSLILIGERPGLSSPDSMGAYLTYKPQPGLTDEARNCISNIRNGGLNIEPAATKIFYLITQALTRKLTGIDLKDDSGLLREVKG